MEEKTADLQKLKKKEILEIMLRQGEEIDLLRSRIVELELELEKRNIILKQSDSVAEASLRMTDVFKEAEKAAEVYLDNIKRRYV